MQFPNNIRFANLFLASLFFLTFIPIIIIGSLWIFEEHKNFKKTLRSHQDKYLNTQKQIIKSEVLRAINFIENSRTIFIDKAETALRARTRNGYQIVKDALKANQDKPSSEEIKTLVKQTLRPIRFSQKQYPYFILCRNGSEILSAPSALNRQSQQPKNEERAGNLRFPEMFHFAREHNEGIYRYSRPKRNSQATGDTDTVRNIAYVKYVEPLDWAIGTELSVADIEMEAQQDILQQIGSVRFGEDGYIFVVRYDGVTLMNSTQPHLIGQNLWDLSDPNGVKVIQEERKAVENPQGDFIQYVWNKPSLNKAVPKVSYVKGVADWQWMVGAGLYLDEIESISHQATLSLTQEVNQKISNIIFILISISFLNFCTATYFSRRIKGSLSVFTSFFTTAAMTNKMIHTEKIFFAELLDLANCVNRMIQKKIEIEQKKNEAEAEKELVVEQLHHAQKMEAIGTLAGGIAHDFNNLLTIILGYCELIQEQHHEKYGEVMEELEEVRGAGLQAKELVRQILNFYRKPDSNIPSSPLSISVIVKECVKLLRGTLPANIQIEAHIDEECGSISATPSHINQIIMNLCTNSYHAMEKQKGGSLMVSLLPLAEAGKVDNVVLTVSDTGKGISPDILDKIFKPYFTTKAENGGTGLGLAVVRDIVNRNGWRIEVDTALGKGTSFHVYFPITQGKIEIPSKEQSLLLPHGRRERILFVDDEKGITLIAQTVLEKKGYMVTVVNSSITALDIFKEHPDHFDMVVTDMTMPGMVGSELAQHVLRLRPDIPIILCTGFSSLIDKEQATQLGIRTMVMKPFDFNELASIIRNILDGAGVKEKVEAF